MSFMGWTQNLPMFLVWGFQNPFWIVQFGPSLVTTVRSSFVDTYWHMQRHIHTKPNIIIQLIKFYHWNKFICFCSAWDFYFPWYLLYDLEKNKYFKGIFFKAPIDVSIKIEKRASCVMLSKKKAAGKALFAGVFQIPTRQSNSMSYRSK